MNSDLIETLFLLAMLLIVAVVMVLYVGTPDLMDVILNKLSDGQVPIPKPAP